MIVHDIIPFSLEKNLGKSYNETMQRIPDGDTACLRDGDTCWLTPDYGVHLQKYAEMNPESVLTCYTNRVSTLSKMQLLTGRVSEVSDIRQHIETAGKMLKNLYSVTEINRDISGFCMVVPKSVWGLHPFPEDGLCLGVDTWWGRKIRAAGIKILRMDAIYLWHSYRLTTGIYHKTHLLK